jgi:hypothetical protein
MRSTFEEALSDFDHYPWRKLCPIQVAPAYAEQIWALVRHTSRAREWKKLCQRPACPKCAQRSAVVEIVYGEPDAELNRRADAREIVLGGRPTDLKWLCQKCQVPFRDPLMGGTLSEPKADHEEIEGPLREGEIVSVRPLNRSIAFLMTIGFFPAGYWQQGGQGGIVPVLHAKPPKKRDALYAFASRGEGFGEEQVHYIGRTTQLASKIREYQKPNSSQRMNVTVHREIAKVLAAGTRVDVLVLGDLYLTGALLKGLLLRYSGPKVGLAARLKKALIGELDPPWNNLGR